MVVKYVRELFIERDIDGICNCKKKRNLRRRAVGRKMQNYDEFEIRCRLEIMSTLFSQLAIADPRRRAFSLYKKESVCHINNVRRLVLLCEATDKYIHAGCINSLHVKVRLLFHSSFFTIYTTMMFPVLLFFVFLFVFLCILKYL